MSRTIHITVGWSIAVSVITLALFVATPVTAQTLKDYKNFTAKWEGLSLESYPDAGGYSIGYGHFLGTNQIGRITKAQAERLLAEDIFIAYQDVKTHISTFSRLTANQRLILVDMRYNLGATGFRKFARMLRAVQILDAQQVIKEMRDSNWYNQTGNRAKHHVRKWLS